MATLREALLPALSAARGIAPALGLHPSSLTVRQRTWSGNRPGSGTSSNTDTSIVPTPHMRQMSLTQIAGSGGQYQQGDIVVGPITPAFVGGGYVEDDLKPPLAAGQTAVERIYVVTGQLAGEYALVELRRDNPLHFELVLRRTIRVP